jgi:glycosyltransferase involved in cell wall biosynthesis
MVAGKGSGDVVRRDGAAVCLIVKNEARYLVEWVAHYLAMGFDEILVYDNGSTDSTAAVVDSFARRESAVTLHAWPDLPGRVPQTSAYADAMHRTRCEWLAFFDADELLVLKQHDRIQEFLGRYPDETGAVAINWLLFGSSGQRSYVDELQSIRFRMCARNAPGTKNRFVKSIVRVDATAEAGVHTVRLKPGFRYYGDDGQLRSLLGDAKTATVSHEYAQLNHYVVRSLQEFREKRARGNATRTIESPEKYAGRDERFWKSHSTNHREDSAIDPWVAKAAGMRRKLLSYIAADGISCHGQ